MVNLLKTKLIACCSHLVLSVIVISLFVCSIWHFWFPGLIFDIQEVFAGLVILIAADATLGPLLTFILYKPGKKGLTFDLTLIAILQCSALIYGAFVIYETRTAALVFAVDRFEIAAYSDIKNKALPSRLDNLSHFHPPKVYLKVAKTLTSEQLSSLNKRLAFEPEFYYNLIPHASEVRAAALDITTLDNKNPRYKKNIEEFKQSFPDYQQKLIVLPLQGRNYSMKLIVLDKETLKTVSYIDYPVTETTLSP